MYKVNDKDTRTTPVACSKTPCSSVPIVIFEQVNTDWVLLLYQIFKLFAS